MITLIYLYHKEHLAAEVSDGIDNVGDDENEDDNRDEGPDTTVDDENADSEDPGE